MYHLIINPISGRKKNNKQELINQITKRLDELKLEYKWHYSKYAKHPTIIASEIEKEYGTGDIIVIGGDGTLSEVINGLNNPSNFNIGLIPTGSGNDFASHIKLDVKHPMNCLEKIVSSKPTSIDYIQVNEKKCVNVIGTGIDVLVLQKFEKFNKLHGKIRYFVALISALLTFKWYEFDLSIDDKEFVHKKGFMVGICNGSTIGGGIPICPGAIVDDLKLEYVFVNKISRLIIPFYLIKLMGGKILKAKVTEHIYCKKAVFKSKDNLVIQVDGNISSDSNYITCQVVEKGLNFYK